MLRKLLTLLAVLSGLAAINAPVQAQISAADGAAIERVDTTSLGRANLTVAAAAKVQGGTGSARRECCPPQPRPPFATIVVTPTIQLGDRARE